MNCARFVVFLLMPEDLSAVSSEGRVTGRHVLFSRCQDAERVGGAVTAEVLSIQERLRPLYQISFVNTKRACSEDMVGVSPRWSEHFPSQPITQTSSMFSLENSFLMSDEELTEEMVSTYVAIYNYMYTLLYIYSDWFAVLTVSQNNFNFFCGQTSSVYKLSTLSTAINEFHDVRAQNWESHRHGRKKRHSLNC